MHCCVTSPPYWGLRDYGTRRWFGGDAACEHDQKIVHGPHHPGQVEQTIVPGDEGSGKGQNATTNSCSKCGAWWGQLGLEPTPQGYVRNMVEVFRAVRRVLHPTGTLWLNLGDSYTSRGNIPEGMKPKDLVGIPWEVALALRNDGWFLRCDIIWDKVVVKPESVKDRPTREHEYLFLCSKREHYYYDQEAIRENIPEEIDDDPEAFRGRNMRTVWTINPKPYGGAHFAVFPPELPALCVKAGSSEKGCCPTCGAPWARRFEKLDVPVPVRASQAAVELGILPAPEVKHVKVSRETGWVPTCKCAVLEPVPSIVMDPFAGSGTTLAVAKELGRDYTAIEISPEYAKLIEGRLKPVNDRRDGQAAYLLSRTFEEEP